MNVKYADHVEANPLSIKADQNIECTTCASKSMIKNLIDLERVEFISDQMQAKLLFRLLGMIYKEIVFQS